MLQSFSGPTLPGGSNKKPRSVCAGGVWNSCCSGPYGALPTTTTTDTMTTAAGAVLVGSKRSGLRSLGTCCVENKLNLYKHRFYVFTMDLFSSTKIARKITVRRKRAENKNPAGARFLSAWLQVVAASTLYYVNAKSIRDRCSSRNLRSVFLCHRVWMRGADLSKKYCSSIQYLSILGVFTLCHSGAASLTGATKSWLKRVVPSVP